MSSYLAIDIGASSGRHILGRVEDGRIRLQEIYRFPNRLVQRNGHLCWDLDALYGHVLEGLRACKAAGCVPDTIGIDTWAVDFVLLDQAGQILGDTVAYRDARTQGMAEKAEQIIPFSELYRRTGIQKQPFNTIYQLLAVGQEALNRADRLMMIPDYLHWKLTGVQKFEYTNATSTGLVDAEKKDWAWDVLDRLGFPRRLFPALSVPGTAVGPLSPETARAVGFDSRVVLPATHDTGSAFLAVPARSDHAVYLSSGTWSLLGTELRAPITTPESMAANFTNEGGYDYRYRYLKNIMGLWMIQSIRREVGEEHSFQELIDAAEASGYQGVIDVNAPEFLAPDSMLQAVKDRCAQEGQPIPGDPAQALACVYQSLAVCYANAVRELSRLTGRSFDCIHIVGGGSNAAYLNRLTARASGLPVLAGPTEGTALGNLLAQMIAAGEFSGVDSAREAIHHSFDIQEVQP